MKKPRSLLLRAPLLPGESLPSFLVRLANLNGYHTPKMVIQLCQERLSQPDTITYPTRVETYAQLADLVGVSDGQLYGASAHKFAFVMLPADEKANLFTLRSGDVATVLPKGVLGQHTWPETDVQFCPYCLREASYHRRAWLPESVSVCLEHDCLLTKGCPQCGSKLKIEDVVEGCCGQCEFELGTSPTISVAGDTAGLLSQRTIQSWLGLAALTGGGRYGLPRQPDFVLYQIVYGLHRAIWTIRRRWDFLHDPFDVDTATALFPCAKKTDVTPFKSYVLYATAFKALLNWPFGFFEFLNAFKRRDEAEPVDSVSQDLGCIYTTWLKNSWKHPDFLFLQETFEEYMEQNFALSLALQQKYRSPDGSSSGVESGYSNYSDAAQRLNTSALVVERAVALRFLSGHPGSGKNRTAQEFRLVSGEEISSLKHRWRYGIPLSDAARLLGVSQKITLDLVKAGLMKAVAGPSIDGYKVWKIGSQSLAYFLKRLERGWVRYYYSQPVEAIRLRVAAESVAPAGTWGLSRSRADRNRPSNTTWLKLSRSAAGSPGAISGP